MLKSTNVLAFDFGTVFIGVALGDKFIKQARPLTTIKRKNKTYDWLRISKLISDWRPVCLIVGNPLTLDNKAQTMTKLADKFSLQLQGRYGLPVFKVDERLTSKIAEVIICDNNYQKTKELIDQMAAQIILQAWFDEL